MSSAVAWTAGMARKRLISAAAGFPDVLRRPPFRELTSPSSSVAH